MIWDERTKTMLFLLKGRGRPDDVCAQTLSDLLDQEITETDVLSLWANMEATGWIAKRLKAKKNHKSRKDQPHEDFIGERRRLIEANIYHLIDLKRAGHSPSRTELTITTEGAGVRYPTAPVSSYIGSSAGMCAEGL